MYVRLFSNGAILMVTLLVCMSTSLDLNCTEASVSLFQLLPSLCRDEDRVAHVHGGLISQVWQVLSPSPFFSHLRFDQIWLHLCPSFDCHDCCLIYYGISQYKDDQLIRLDWLNWNVIQTSMCILYIVFFFLDIWSKRKAVSSFCLFLFKDRFSVWYSTHLFLK